MPRFKGWRTLALNAGAGIGTLVVLILGYLQTVDVSNLLTPQQALLWTVGINVANIILRFYTDTPPGRRD